METLHQAVLFSLLVLQCSAFTNRPSMQLHPKVLSGVRERYFPTVQLKATSEENPAEIFGKELQELRDGIDEFQSKTFESLYDKKVMWSKAEDTFSVALDDTPKLQEISASNAVSESSHSPPSEDNNHESTSSFPIVSDDTKPTAPAGNERTSSSSPAISSSPSPAIGEKQRTDERLEQAINSEFDPDVEFSESSTSAAVIARTKMASSTAATPPSSNPQTGPESSAIPKVTNTKPSMESAEEPAVPSAKVAPKTPSKTSSAKSGPEKPVVPAMFVMNEVALKTEPAVTGDSRITRDEDGVISLKSIPVDTNRSVVSSENDVKDVLRAQQAVTKSFISLASQLQTNEESVTPAITKAEEVSSKASLQSKTSVPPSQPAQSEAPKKIAREPKPTEVVQRSESVNQAVKAAAPETLKKAEAVFKEGSSVFNSLFGGLLKNDPSFELSQKQKSEQPAVKTETKAVEASIQTPKSTKISASVPSTTATTTKKTFVQPSPPPKPRGLEGLLSFLNSDPSLQYAQQQQEERKREEQEVQRALRAATTKKDEEDTAFSTSAEAMLRELPRPVVVVREKKGNNVANAPPRAVQKVSPPVVTAQKPLPKEKEAPVATSSAATASKSSSTSGFSLSGLFGPKATSSVEVNKPSTPVTSLKASTTTLSTVSRSVVSVGEKKSTLPSSTSATTPKTTSATAASPVAKASTAASETNKKSEGGLFGRLFGSKAQTTTTTDGDKKPLSASASADALSAKTAVASPSPATKVDSGLPKKTISSADSGKSIFGIFSGAEKTPATSSTEKTVPVATPKTIIPVAKKGTVTASSTAQTSSSMTTSASLSSTSSKSKSDGGIFGGLFGGNNNDSKSIKKPVESKETAKTISPSLTSKQVTPKVASATKTASLTPAIGTTTSEQLAKTPTKGLFGGLFDKFDSSNNKNNKQARAMNPAFQQLVSQQLRGDRVALQRFQSATDALRVGTLDAAVYLQELRSIFATNKVPSTSPFAAKRETATDEVIRKVVPPLISEMPEREVAKKLATAYTVYLESLQKPSASTASLTEQSNGKGGGFFSNILGGKKQKVDDGSTVKESKPLVNQASTTSVVSAKAKGVPSTSSAIPLTKPAAPSKASSFSSSSKAGSATSTTSSSQLPDKVPLAKRNLVAQQVDDVARNRIPASALATYLIKDIGTTRSRPFVEELARLLPKEKATEFLRAFEAAATK